MLMVASSGLSVTAAPRSGAAATVRGFPDAAADSARVGNDAPVGCRGRIDNDIVDPAFG